MRASTLPRYLLGSRDAIISVASSRWSILIGAIFVLSAGFAREYDGEDLVHEPWHALRPLGASLASGTLLFLIIHGSAMFNREDGEGEPPSFLRAYRSFLGLFWMTAPMAWLYAIPYERMLSPVDAIGVNLWTLALVAAWRVALMVRVVSVIYGVRRITAFFLVMFFADAVVIAVVTLVPTPVIDIMGGLRHTERDALVSSITLLVGFFSIATAPIWVIGALVAAFKFVPRWPQPAPGDGEERSRGLLTLALVSVVAFVPLLVVSQPEQINRREAERLLMAGDVDTALALMSRKEAGDYPPHWNPPPRLGYREDTPDLASVRDAMLREWPADWIAAIYLEKISRNLRRELWYWGPTNWAELVELLEEDEPHRVEPAHADDAAFLRAHVESLPESERDALARIVQWGRRDAEPPAESTPTP